MALQSFSRPKGLATFSLFHVLMMSAEMTDMTALSAYTQALPMEAMMAPASKGPTTLDVFIDTAFNANPEGICDFGSNSGTTEEKTGHLMAKPMPLQKVKAMSIMGDKLPKKTSKLKMTAMTAIHI